MPCVRWNNENCALLAFSCLHLLRFFPPNAHLGDLCSELSCVCSACLLAHFHSLPLPCAQLMWKWVSCFRHIHLSASLCSGAGDARTRGAAAAAPCSSSARSRRLPRSIPADVADNVYHVCWLGGRWGDEGVSGESLSLVFPTVTIDFGRNAGD